MSRDLEAGIHDDETIPLVEIVGRERHSNEDEDEGASCCEGTTSPCLNNAGEEDDDKRQEIISDMADNETVESRMKHKIDICEEEGEETFKFIKMKTKPSAEEVAKDAKMFVEIAEFVDESFLVCIEDAEKITDSWLDVAYRLTWAFMTNFMLLTNGLGQKLLRRWENDWRMETVCVTSTSFVTGTAVTDSAHNKQYFGVVDHPKQEQWGRGIRVVLLLEDASPVDVMKYRLAIFKAYSEVEPYCMKMITDGSKEFLNSMADNSYFSDRRGVLIFKNGGLLSSVLFSFVEAFRNGSEMVEEAEEDMKSVCKEYFSENDCIDVVDLITDNIKQNIAKLSTFDDTEEINDEKMKSVILNVLVEGLRAPVTFLLDSSKDICDALSNPEYFKNNNTTLIFEKCGGIPCILADYLQSGKRKRTADCLLILFMDIDNFFANIDQHISMLRVYIANSQESNSMVSRVATFMQKIIKKVDSVNSLSVAEKFSYLSIFTALSQNKPEMFENWPCRQIEIDTYIYCNLRFHWHDTDVRSESKIAEHFEIFRGYDCNKPEWQHMGTNINKAVEKLSNGNIANCFQEDGKPNVEIISPIQALIINRLFCMQLDFVKMLWKFDKENILENAVMIWILINGILKEKIFAREYAADDLVKLKEYFAAAIKWPLDELHCCCNHHQQNNFLRDRIVLFRKLPLHLVAGDGKFYEFLTHTVTKRCISQEWNNHNTDDDDSDDYDNDNDDSKAGYKRIQKVLNKPLIKFYIHMVMYAVSYLLLAYYTLQQKAKASAVIKWVLLTMISSLFVDELRQALGEKQYSIRISLKRWWSDGWNKLDAFSMVIYYIAFILECAGVINASRLLFSTFTFIWCLKFYQFLRAFESLGTYIILVQKMLPQLGNFAIVAIIAIISYGVFMTSILFPNITFKSWSVFIMVLLRPYLLLFAETGINEYDLSTKNTIYNTPKIETASEIIMVVGMCVFLMFGGVLLLNLLIAIFSGIYEEVKEESVKLWALNDLQLLQEFQRKPVLPIPFSLPINVFRLFKRRLTKPKAYPVPDFEIYLYQIGLKQDLTEKLPDWKEKQEASSESTIRGIDTQVAELHKLYQSKNNEIQSAMGSQHKDVKEIQEFLKKTSKESNERAAKSEAHIMDVLKEHQENSLKIMEEKVQKLEGAMGENAQEVNTRVNEMEKKIEEISTLLKQLIESTIEKET